MSGPKPRPLKRAEKNRTLKIPGVRPPRSGTAGAFERFRDREIYKVSSTGTKGRKDSEGQVYSIGNPFTLWV